MRNGRNGGRAVRSERNYDSTLYVIFGMITARWGQGRSRDGCWIVHRLSRCRRRQRSVHIDLDVLYTRIDNGATTAAASN